MNRRLVLITTVVILATVPMAVWLLLPKLQPKPEFFSDSFENGFGDWTLDSQVPEDPNNPGETVAWKIERTSDISLSGDHSVLFQIDGTQDDGTIWLERKLELPPNSAKTVTLSFQLWSPSESFNTIAEVVAYIGEDNAEVEDDFHVLGAADQVAGWKAYSLTVEINTGSLGEVFVAFGISVRWETELSYFADSVEIAAS